MATKRKRKKKISSGARKMHAGENRPRREPVSIDLAGEDSVKHQAARRWPEAWQEDKYFELNNENFTPLDSNKKPRIKPPKFQFAMLESLDIQTLDKLLTAASLRLKGVSRFPGWILQRTYNLKNRPIEII